MTLDDIHWHICLKCLCMLWTETCLYLNSICNVCFYQLYQMCHHCFCCNKTICFDWYLKWWQQSFLFLIILIVSSYLAWLLKSAIILTIAGDKVHILLSDILHYNIICLFLTVVSIKQLFWQLFLQGSIKKWLYILNDVFVCSLSPTFASHSLWWNVI